MRLDQIQGQEKAVDGLKRYAQSGKIPHAFLFMGIQGIGKFSTALAFGAFLNCRNNDIGCPGCTSCVKTFNMNHPDFLRVDVLEGKSNVSIEQIRDLILQLKYAPLEGKYKIAIIDSAEKLNKHSTNALLKTLEEPPKDSVIFLVTSNIRAIPPTVISRCSLIKFSPLGQGIIFQRLVAQGVRENEAMLISRSCEGSLGKALKLAEKNYLETRNSLLETIAGSKSADFDPLEACEFIFDRYKDSLNDVLDVLMLIERDIISVKKGLNRDSLFNFDIFDSLLDLSRRCGLRNLFRNSSLIYLTRNAIFHNNANSKLAFDNLMLGLSHGDNRQ